MPDTETSPTPEATHAESFWEMLRDKHGTRGLHPEIEAAIYAKAWEHGHSDGDSGIDIYYGDYADFALKILGIQTR